MSWSNLLSGLFGALVGGLFSLGAAFLTFKHERSQQRQRATENACNAILENILTINTAVGNAQWALDHSNGSSEPDISSSFETVRSAAQRILYVYNVLIYNEELHSRINDFVDIVNMWRKDAQKAPATVNHRRFESIESYTDYVTDSINAYLSKRTLPSDKPPPDLLETENA